MKVGAFGEVMLRLTPPEYMLLEQSNTLKFDFTGTGVNILSNLSHFGVQSFLQTNLPKNRIGDAGKYKLRMLGIETDFVSQKYDHIGSYFAEVGFASRPTQVTYQNRLVSSFGLAKSSDYDHISFAKDMDLIHICGIALSLTEDTYKSALNLAKEANKQGKKVCFDFNFRPSLNTELGKKEIMKERYKSILPYCDIVLGTTRDLVELMKLREKMPLNISMESDLVNEFKKNYSIEWFAGTRRENTGASKSISGFLYTKNALYQTEYKAVEVLDRIGTGDAFASGILLSYIEKWDNQAGVEFAIVNAVLAHTIHGDVPLTTRDQIYRIMKNPGIELIR